MSARRGSHRIERLPSARGPHSMRPWNQPTTWPVGDRRRGAPAELVRIVDALDACSRQRRSRPRWRSIAALDRAVGERRARGRRGPSTKPRGAAVPVPDGEGRADRAAGVARGRLDVELAGRACARRSCRWRPSSWRSRRRGRARRSPVRRVQRGSGGGRTPPRTSPGASAAMSRWRCVEWSRRGARARARAARPWRR